MNLLHLKSKKAQPLRFEDYKDEGKECPVIFVRLADQEYAARVTHLIGQAKAAAGEGKDAPDEKYLEVAIRAHLGTTVTGWRNWLDTHGQPLPDRDETGNLNEDVGVALLGVEEINDAIELRLNKLREERKKRFEAVLGNSVAPLPPN